jgi:tripartite-type tricarboxylate transporter receptor subunit TctC
MDQLLADPGFQEAMATSGYPLCNVSGAALDEAVNSSNTAVAEIMAELGLQ